MCMLWVCGCAGVLCMAQPWPSIARTVHADHQRYLNVYMTQFPGYTLPSFDCEFSLNSSNHFFNFVNLDE